MPMRLFNDQRTPQSFTCWCIEDLWCQDGSVRLATGGNLFPENVKICFDSLFRISRVGKPSKINMQLRGALATERGSHVASRLQISY